LKRLRNKKALALEEKRKKVLEEKRKSALEEKRKKEKKAEEERKKKARTVLRHAYPLNFLERVEKTKKIIFRLSTEKQSWDQNKKLKILIDKMLKSLGVIMKSERDSIVKKVGFLRIANLFGEVSSINFVKDRLLNKKQLRTKVVKKKIQTKGNKKKLIRKTRQRRRRTLEGTNFFSTKNRSTKGRSSYARRKLVSFARREKRLFMFKTRRVREIYKNRGIRRVWNLVKRRLLLQKFSQVSNSLFHIQEMRIMLNDLSASEKIPLRHFVIPKVHQRTKPYKRFKKYEQVKSYTNKSFFAKDKGKRANEKMLKVNKKNDKKNG